MTSDSADDALRVCVSQRLGCPLVLIHPQNVYSALPTGEKCPQADHELGDLQEVSKQQHISRSGRQSW